MTSPPGLSQLSVSAGIFIGVTVGIVTQFLVQLIGDTGGGLNPFRFLLEPFTLAVILILLGLASANFVFQLHRTRSESSTVTVQHIRWFSPGVFWPGVLGALIVSLLVGLIMALGEMTYFAFVFMFAGIFPFIVSLIVLPLGMIRSQNCDPTVNQPNLGLRRLTASNEAAFSRCAGPSYLAVLDT